MINENFLINNKTNLLQIYDKERFFTNKGIEGALFINFTEPEKVDVYYWSLDLMHEKFRVKLIKEMQKNIDIKNKKYFIGYDDKDINIILIKQ